MQQQPYCVATARLFNTFSYPQSIKTFTSVLNMVFLKATIWVASVAKVRAPVVCVLLDPVPCATHEHPTKNLKN